MTDEPERTYTLQLLADGTYNVLGISKSELMALLPLEQPEEDGMSDEPKRLRCCLCGRRQKDVCFLIVGLHGAICTSCVPEVVKIMAEAMRVYRINGKAIRRTKKDTE